MIFPLKVALRFLKSGKGQTILILSGIIIGISVQVFIGLLIDGLQISLIDSTVGNTSQITIESSERNEVFELNNKLINSLESDFKNIKHISPSLNSQVFLTINDKVEPSVFRGLDFERADGIYQIDDRLKEGSVPKGENEIIVGIGLKNIFDLEIGQEVEFFNFEGISSQAIITGFFDFKVASINNSWVIGDLNDFQNIFEKNNKISNIEIQLNDVFKAEELSLEILKYIDDEDIIVSNWKEANQDLLSGLNGQSVSSVMIQIFVIVAVVLGISSVLAISVLQKSKQIGILKAMGVNNKNTSLIFLFQGLILGILGGILGVILGLLLIFSFTLFATNPDGSPIVPIYINYGFILFSFLIAVISSTIASLIPARKSAKLEPMEVIRNG